MVSTRKAKRCIFVACIGCIVTFAVYRNYRELSFYVKPTQGEAERDVVIAHLPMIKRLSDMYKKNPIFNSYLNQYDGMFNKSFTVGSSLEKIARSERHVNANSKTILCAMQTKAYIKILDSNTSPLREIGLGKYFGGKPLLDKVPRYGTCAIVGSSPAVLKSSRGIEIDAHDAVLRFNSAPTKNFENDVGTKTTIRLLNNRYLESDGWAEEFAKTDMSRDTILVSWKGGKSAYNGNLATMVRTFGKYWVGYVNWTVSYPDRPIYIVNPVSQWRGWDVIQEFTNYSIPPNVPSSGFLGVQLMLPLCESVDVYGIVQPENGAHSTCKYFSENRCPPPAGPGKEYYHPLDPERKLLLKMNVGSEEDVKTFGKVTLPGFATRPCD
ncbi:beta-galactoside alpha-2,6-sialyltransferase 2-like [Ptychodera flava]|uniref:beta-galactoside alpha-2,6-sialyltransferase 2-like n=1 Tax=Ptychodera flava TaxID=63121 RepID=UPI003969DCB8